MNSPFQNSVETTLAKIDEALDDCDSDVDSELADGMLTLRFEDGSVIIFSTQHATEELWLAARSGAFHFKHDEQQWLCTKSNNTLKAIFESAFLDQAGTGYNFPI